MRILAAMGIVSINNNFLHEIGHRMFRFSFLTPISDADLTYQQGLNRMWSSLNLILLVYWPSLANLVELGILNKETFYNDDFIYDLSVRVPRTCILPSIRYKPSILTGKFRSNAARTLDSCYLSQDFAALPALNAAFSEDDPPSDRVVAVPSELHNGYLMFNS